MSRIRIKNFGPIKDGYQKNGGWMDIKKVTVFIGNQASGKSSVAKLFSTMTWCEKALFRGDIDKSELKRKSKFQNYFCGYQNIKNYFKPDTEIKYKGDAYNFRYNGERLYILESKKDYLVPKIMYIPAERNFVSVVSQPEKLKYLPKPLYTFLDEFERSKKEISTSLKLPINNLEFRYDKNLGARVVGKDHNIDLSEASSGLQSAIPLFIVSKNLAEGINIADDNSQSSRSLEDMQRLRNRLEKILTHKEFTEEQKKTAIDVLSSLKKNDCFVNIVEEPEQNLFPGSQRYILNSLLKFANMNVGNKLIITTHSPYIINYLTLAIKAKSIEKSDKHRQKTITKLNEIVPLDSMVNSEDVSIYQMDEQKGIINLLDKYKGLPSDENMLNDKLGEGNELFAKLLEIQQGL